MPQAFQTVPLQVNQDGEKTDLTPKQRVELEKFNVRRIGKALTELLKPQKNKNSEGTVEELTENLEFLSSESSTPQDLEEQLKNLKPGVILTAQIHKTLAEGEQDVIRKKKAIKQRKADKEMHQAELKADNIRLNQLQPPGALNVIPNLFRYAVHRRDIERIEHRRQKERDEMTSAFTDISALEGDVEKIEASQGKAVKVVNAFGKQLTSASISAISSVATSYFDITNALHTDTELKQQLDDELLTKVLDPVLKKLIASESIESEEASEYRQDVRNALREGFTIFLGAEVENEKEVMERRDRMEAFENSLSYDDKQSLDAATWLLNPRGRNPRQAYDSLLSLLVGTQAVKSFDGIAFAVDSSDLSQEEKSRLVDELDNQKSSGFDIRNLNLKSLNNALENDKRRWPIIRENRRIQDLFGLQSLSDAEASISKKIISELMLAKEHDDETIKLGYHLLEFHRLEDTPFILMNFFREPGHSGEKPFLSIHAPVDETTAYKFATGLSKEDLAKLRQMNVPGMMDVVEGIRENGTPASDFRYKNPPDRWDALVAAYNSLRKGSNDFQFVGLKNIRHICVDRSVRDIPADTLESYHANLKRACAKTGDDFEKTRQAIEERSHGDPELENPGYKRVQQGLAKMCLHYMGEGSDKEKIYILGLLERLEFDSGSGLNMFDKILADTKSDEVQSAIVDRLATMTEYRYNSQAAMILLDNYGRQGIKYKLDDSSSNILQCVLSNDLTPKNLRDLSDLTELDFESLTAVNGFLKTVRQAYEKAPEKHYFDTDQILRVHKEDFGKCLDIANTPGACELICDLTAYGYEFDPEHSKVMSEMISSKEKILSAVKVLDSSVKGYKYRPCVDEKQAVTDPYMAYAIERGPRDLVVDIAQGEASPEMVDGLLKNYRGPDLSAEDREEFVSCVKSVAGTIVELGDLIAADIFKSMALNPKTVSGNLKKHGKKIFELYGELNKEARYSYIDCQGGFSRLVAQPMETLDTIMGQNYSPAALFGVFGVFEQGELKPEFTGKLVAALPRSSDVMKDTYNVEYLTSYLHKNPKEQKAILTDYVNAFPNFETDDCMHLLNVMTLTDSLSTDGFAQKISERLNSGCKSPTALSAAAVGDASEILSKKYDPELISQCPGDKLSRWINVYSTYEQSIRHFTSGESEEEKNLLNARIGALRVIATVELQGDEKIDGFRRNDPKVLNDLVENSQKYFPDESERKAAVEYIQTRLSGMEENKVFPEGEYTPEQRKKILDEFHDRRHKMPHTLSDVCVDDRIDTVYGTLDDLFHKRHFSPALQDIEMLNPGQNPMQELGERGTACARLIAELSGKKAKTPKKADVEREARIGAYMQGMKSEIEGLPPEQAKDKLKSMQKEIIAKQKSLGKWADIREVGVNYEGKFDALTDKIKASRERLGEQSEVIESLGFSFTESFRKKVYSGDIELLSQAVDKALVGEKTGYRKAELTKLNETISELKKTYSDADSYLDGLLPGMQTTLGLLREKQFHAQNLRDNLLPEDSNEVFLKKIELFDPRLREYIGRRLKEDSIPDDMVRPTIIQIVDEYKDSSAIQDVENLVSAIKPSENQDTVVHTYGHEPVFTSCLEAMKGQCLDYRSSVNSIGNCVYNMDLMDASRALTVSRDERGEARYDSINYLTRVEDGEKSMTALVTDPFYVPDGSVLSWAKIEGHIQFLMEKAEKMGVPLVIPASFIGNNEGRFQDMQSESGKKFEKKNMNVSILTGPTKEVYCELSGYGHFTEDTQDVVEGFVYEPKA